MMHCFDIDIAQQYGVNCAVLLENLRYWIEKNRANNKNFHDGYYWTYNSVKAFAELFPYISPRQISTALNKLEESGLIITGNYNDVTYDRTMWYAITEKGFALLEKRDYEETEISENTVNEESSDTVKNEGAEMSNALCKNVKCITPKCKMDYAEMSNPLCKNVESIPNNKPNNKPNIKAEEAATRLSRRDCLKVIQLYCSIFTRTVSLTAMREQTISTIVEKLKELGLTTEDLFKRAYAAKFLKDKAWATFDWIIDPEHAVRIIEGCYDELKEPTALENHSSYDLEQFKADALKPLIYSKKQRSAS